MAWPRFFDKYSRKGWARGSSGSATGPALPIPSRGGPRPPPRVLRTPLAAVKEPYENRRGQGSKKVAGQAPVSRRGRPSRVTMMAAPGEEQRSDQTRPAADLLPEVYGELRRLAEAMTVGLRPGQTLQATA